MKKVILCVLFSIGIYAGESTNVDTMVQLYQQAPTTVAKQQILQFFTTTMLVSLDSQEKKARETSIKKTLTQLDQKERSCVEPSLKPFFHELRSALSPEINDAPILKKRRHSPLASYALLTTLITTATLGYIYWKRAH